MPLYINESDNNLMVHFGTGDLLVSTNEQKTDGIHTHRPDEVIITPCIDPGPIGEYTDQFAGKTTAEMKPGVRLCFESKESAQVVIDALQKVVDLWPEEEEPDHDEGGSGAWGDPLSQR